MGSLNRVYLMGNLTKAPELRHTPAGTAVLDLRLAVDDSYRNQAGETVERTTFADVTVWGKQAEACGEHLDKGSSVLVEGALELNEWTDPQGQKHSRLRVRAGRVQFVGRPRRGNGGEPPARVPAAAAAATGSEPAEDTPF